VRAAAGFTYRQLDYWCRRGYLNVDGTGSGHERDFPPIEVAVAELMGVLTRVGFTAAAAADVARLMVEGNLGIVDLGEGVHLSLIVTPLPPDTVLTPAEQDLEPAEEVPADDATSAA
jgi:hypothetical protein